MDPEETLAALLDAAANNCIEDEETAEHARALIQWLDMGGFVPACKRENLRHYCSAVIALGVRTSLL